MQQQTMANEKDSDDGWLVALEDDYVQSIGAEPDYEHQYTMERDASMRAMWTGFQESATSIAQLYRGKFGCTPRLWLLLSHRFKCVPCTTSSHVLRRRLPRPRSLSSFYFLKDKHTRKRAMYVCVSMMRLRASLFLCVYHLAQAGMQSLLYFIAFLWIDLLSLIF